MNDKDACTSVLGSKLGMRPEKLQQNETEQGDTAKWTESSCSISTNVHA